MRLGSSPLAVCWSLPMYPLKQGLKPSTVMANMTATTKVFTHVSIKTRIETGRSGAQIGRGGGSLPMYPLKQGLKPSWIRSACSLFIVFTHVSIKTRIET